MRSPAILASTVPHRRRVLAGLAGALAAPALLSTGRIARASGTQCMGVVELFTSQGCSSCPPADAALSRLVEEESILALSWHVDYWNYLGWRDTFSDPLFTARQRAYAAGLGRRGVYTPQAVVNGRVHEVGSKEAIVRAIVADFAGGPRGLTVPLAITADGGALSVRAEGTGMATLYAVAYAPRSTVRIERGENAGRRALYSNVVRALAPVGMMKDGVLDAILPPDAVAPTAGDDVRIALLLQRVDRTGALGPIVGARRLPVGA